MLYENIAVQCVVIGRIPQAWDGDVTPLTVLWCRVPTWRDKNNKTHYKRGICCIQWGHNYCYELFCLFTCRVHINITMSVFVIGETTNNKHYSTLLKTHLWIVNGKFFKYEHILTSQYYNENKSPAFFHCVYIWAVLYKSPHRDVDMWGGVWMRRFRRAWTSLNFD